MSAPLRVAFIGNSLPRRCGIATFTTNLQQAVASLPTPVDTCIVAMTDHDHVYEYPSSVRAEVHANRLEDYERAAGILNDGHYGAVSLQHEFGIFGGEAGGHVMSLLSRLRMPIVTTLHTVLAAPTPVQREVMAAILSVSARVIVMANKGRELLQEVYRQPPDRLEVIPHGTPDVAFSEPDAAKAELGYSGRPVILTFGLLSPSKGIEVMIDAMPRILERQPDALYVVLGATHPNLVREQGEAYRQSLQSRVAALGLDAHVVFLDQFVDQAMLLRFIAMCDVYVTPYLNEAQMTSGTLAYSYGLGKPVVSTPYWHARELLADGKGVLVPFGDPAAIGDAIGELLTDEPRRNAMRRRAYEDSRPKTWSRVAERYRAVFGAVQRAPPVRIGTPSASGERAREVVEAAGTKVSHLLAMSDDTGLFQHALQCVPDRSHGYCTDDNSRALLVACSLANPGEQPLPEPLPGRYAAFLQHAWNRDTRRFRNFMGFDRRWLEDVGSEDSHGRALWALGECARSGLGPQMRKWAATLFAESSPAIENFRSPRAWSFTLLGLDGYCSATPQDARATRLRQVLADRLVVLRSRVRTDDWDWFEEGLSYDNARLSQSLIASGSATGNAAWSDAGLATLRWLMSVQTTEEGRFRPVGSQGFGARRMRPMAFDQQPLEATAAISACLAALRIDRDPGWRAGAGRAFSWYFGNNDLSLPLIDLETGSCRDGLHPDRANENRGGESIVSWLLAVTEMRQLARISEEHGLRRPAMSVPLSAAGKVA
jgi:glycosyltransferase involved in cell wall biosynthesis